MATGADRPSGREPGRVAGHAPLPRYRQAAVPAVLAHGFRPFFLLAGIWAPVALALSVATIRGWITLPTAFDPIAWHYHEMLFGFVAATVTGFLLTAIPNWTGRLPLQGGPLLALAGLWLAGRIAVAASALVGMWPAAVVDLAFLAAVAAVALREVVAGKNWRNLPVVSAVLLFLACNLLSHGAVAGLVDDGLARRAAIAVIIALITLIGGRIIPSFSRNWLVKRDPQALPASFGVVDRVSLAATALALAWWAAAPVTATAAALAGLAAALNAVRLARWRGWRTRAEPLLWVLHVGYLWIPIGLALLAASFVVEGLSQTSAIHALTAGAMGTMTMAVMSRATLGHTGRELRAGPGLSAAYVLVTVAALTRLIASAWTDAYMPLVITSASAWIVAFALYLAVCGPMLARAQPPGAADQK